MKVEIGKYGKLRDVSASFEPGVTAISGPNGAGKSTLLDAIMFAIYGRDRFGGQNAVSVEVGGYDFERWRTGKNTKATLDLPEGGLIEGHRTILEALAGHNWLTIDDALITWFGSQGALGFVNMSPTERRLLLERLLRLDVWDKALAVAKQKRDQAGQDVNRLEGVIQTLRDTANRLEGEKQSIEEQLAGLPEGVEVSKRPPYTLAQIEAARAELETIHTRINEAKDALLDAENALAVTEARPVAFDLNDLNAAQSTVARLTRNINTARKAVEIETPCPDEMRNACQFARNALASREMLAQFEQELEEAQKRVDELTNRRLQYDAWSKQRAAQSNEVKNLRAKVGELERRRENLLKVLSYEAQTKEYDAERNALAERRIKLEQRLETIGREFEHTLERLREAEDKKNAAEVEHEVWSQAATDFGPRGVRAFMVEQALPDLERQVNDALEVLGAWFGARFTVEKELSKGGKGATMDILMLRPDAEPYSVSQASGGERVLLDLALRVALMKAMRKAGYYVPDILILDETLAPLDKGKRLAALSGIKKLGVERVVLTSHVEELLDYADSIVEVGSA